MTFEKYIVKIQAHSDVDNSICNLGTGILISSSLVITANHVAIGSKATIVFYNGESYIAIRCTTTESPVCVFEMNTPINVEPANVFSLDNAVSVQTPWVAMGYIGQEQIEHSIARLGIYDSIDGCGDADKYLSDVKAGLSYDYEEMSGSPVFVDGRIVGILQQQSIGNNGALGLKISSIEMFINSLPKDCIVLNKSLMTLFDNMKSFTLQQIGKNIQSKKYIKEIFVEENSYKENLRAFVEPKLFLQKNIYLAKSCNRARKPYPKIGLIYNLNVYKFIPTT